ncbi:hypothetical protein MWH25_05665 [Natroniella acetigena]|uniref:hypothetical protein n=1 Tax=Natroniella acetigena TaxID=52004 RepID=UPI00200A53BE|nr:hypothetical protein [Natroniella acetigena]MCK8827227.1 hypothetical protein [Natroniella acetigena]
MPDNLILPDKELVNKFFNKYNLDFYYFKLALKHIKEFLLASLSKEFSAKTTDITEYSDNHRTTIDHFLLFMMILSVKRLSLRHRQNHLLNRQVFIVLISKNRVK